MANLCSNKKFIVNANNFSDRSIYNDVRTINCNQIKKPFITYKEIMNGGILTFEMTTK